MDKGKGIYQPPSLKKFSIAEQNITSHKEIIDFMNPNGLRQLRYGEAENKINFCSQKHPLIDDITNSLILTLVIKSFTRLR